MYVVIEKYWIFPMLVFDLLGPEMSDQLGPENL